MQDWKKKNTRLWTTFSAQLQKCNLKKEGIRFNELTQMSVPQTRQVLLLPILFSAHIPYLVPYLTRELPQRLQNVQCKVVVTQNHLESPSEGRMSTMKSRKKYSFRIMLSCSLDLKRQRQTVKNDFSLPAENQRLHRWPARVPARTCSSVPLQE